MDKEEKEETQKRITQYNKMIKETLERKWGDVEVKNSCLATALDMKTKRHDIPKLMEDVEYSIRCIRSGNEYLEFLTGELKHQVNRLEDAEKMEQEMKKILKKLGD